MSSSSKESLIDLRKPQRSMLPPHFCIPSTTLPYAPNTKSPPLLGASHLLVEVHITCGQQIMAD